MHSRIKKLGTKLVQQFQIWLFDMLSLPTCYELSSTKSGQYYQTQNDESCSPDPTPDSKFSHQSDLTKHPKNNMNKKRLKINSNL